MKKLLQVDGAGVCRGKEYPGRGNPATGKPCRQVNLNQPDQFRPGHKQSTPQQITSD
ncbi:MAG: hypothetical protein ACNA7V_01895 [Bacteroidales bacterium]